MEKYSQWNDKASGVNPFVPLRNTTPSLPVRLLGGLVVFVLRAPILLLGVALLLIGELLELVLPLPLIRRIIRLSVVRIGSRLCLVGFGYLSISCQTPNVRRFRLGRQGTIPSPSFGSTASSGDVIVCNKSSILDHLIVAYLFGADVAVVGSNTKGSGYLERISATRAFLRSLGSGSPAVETSTDQQTDANASNLNLSELAVRNHSRSPLVVYPECAPTNGTAVLQFSKSVSESDLKLRRTHVLGIKYKGRGTQTIGGYLKHLLGLTADISGRSTSVVFVAHESVEASRKQEKSESVETPSYRSLMALSVGDRGAKCVDFNAQSFLDFSSTWTKNLEIAEERRKKKL